ncbi:FUSC family protein [Acetobacter farinalis]|uniref:FUSC family protein n=1 Tax=Acetobacter farinalis TaxID=1260984 RepID=A0ABT3Q9V9_9PROT|nr:FUSC family protein [Acetobacter farinalis]MCX2562069.1 FUSC family protein [Acetobacter farinalis]NHO30673.1 FUSC family protein [Acetobacter farinalis]
MKKNLPLSFPRKQTFLRVASRSIVPSAVAHWLGVRAIAIAPEQVAVREGLRAGVAVGTVMLLALYLRMPLMAWSAFAAFWTCLVDPGGLLRPRLDAMLKFAALGTVLSGAISAAAGAGPLAAFTGLGVAMFGCALGRLRGPIATQIGVLAAIVAVVAVCYPFPPQTALRVSGLFAVGSIWATLICVLAWPVDPYMPLRLACSALLREEERMTRRLLDFMTPGGPSVEQARASVGAFRREIRSRIERTRGRIDVLSADAISSRTRATLLPAVEACDRIFIALIAFEHAVLSGETSRAARRTVRVVTTMLHRMAHEAQRPEPRPDRLYRHQRLLARLAEQDTDLFGKGAHVCAQAVQDLIQAWQTLASGSQQATRQTEPGALPRPTAPRLPAFRHAARLCVSVLVAYAISLTLHLPYAYWAMMAVVVVTQPRVTTTLPRTIERVIGSIAGGLLAAVMGVLLPVWSIVLLIFPLAAATIALRSVNYALCVMFMTQLFVLVTDLVNPGLGWDVALARAINNIIGSLVGLAGCLLLWPERRDTPLAAQVAEAFRANIRYAALATGSAPLTWPQIEAARRKAGTTSTRAEIQCQTARLEGLRRSDQIGKARDILFLLRNLAGAASVWWMEKTPDQTPALQQRAALYSRLAERFAPADEACPAPGTPAQPDPTLDEILLLVQKLDLADPEDPPVQAISRGHSS